MRRLLPAVLLTIINVADVAPFGGDLYRLEGTITWDTGKLPRNVIPVVFLQGAVTPFSVQTQAGSDGRFTFKNLPAGTYTLIVDVPRAGELRKTVEVGPSLADAKGRVIITVKFDGAGATKQEQQVSAVELSVPEEAKAEYTKAGNCLARQDVKQAIEHLKKATEIAPQYAAAWNHLGTIAFQSRQYQEAEHYFREALRRDPEAFSPLVNLGGALLAQAKIDESLPVNERAVKVRPEDALAHSQLGQSYYFLGRLDEAERHLKQAKALDPGHYSFPQVMLVEIYARRNQLPAAIAEIEEFLRLHPDSSLVPRMQKALKDAQARLAAKP